MGGRVFRQKTRARARGHVAAPDPSWVKCWFPTRRGVQMAWGGPVAPGYLRRALPSLGHVSSLSEKKELLKLPKKELLTLPNFLKVCVCNLFTS